MSRDVMAEFSKLQVVTPGVGGVASTYFMDLGATKVRPIAQEAFVTVRVGAACVGDGGGDGTIEFKLQGHNTAASLAASGNTIASTGAITEALLIAGAEFRMRFPIDNLYQFVGVFIKPSETFASGTVDIFMELVPSVVY